jgi:hypothetical protein
MKDMKNRIIVIFTLLTGLFLLNSCLKDTTNDYWPDQVAGKMYITVLKPALQSMSLKPVADSVSFSFMINIATDQPPTSDVTVKLAVDPTAVTAYNNRFSPAKTYKPFPNVRILNPTVTIAAGTRTATINGKVWGADQLNACDNFIAGITIQSTTDPNVMIPANMKSYMLSLPISNPYAGDYAMGCYRIHPTAGYSAGPTSTTFSTIDCKTVLKPGVGSYPSYNAQVEVTTETMNVGADVCYKCNVTVIDPATNTVVEGGQYTTFTGDASKPPAPLTNDVNYYNPKTHTFCLNYFYNVAAPRIIYEVISR